MFRALLCIVGLLLLQLVVIVRYLDTRGQLVKAGIFFLSVVFWWIVFHCFRLYVERERAEGFGGQI